jgi:hypothetical protein
MDQDQLTIDGIPMKATSSTGHVFVVDDVELWDPAEELHRLIAAEDRHGPVESPLLPMPRRRRGRTT